MTTVPSFELVGREDELARLRSFVETLEQGPSALVVRGEPGIGKTMLWREAVALAREDGIRVLVTRCAEGEMPTPLGAVSDLLDPVFEQVAEVLPEPQSRALATALGIATEAHARPDRLTLQRAVAASLRALASEAPLLVAIDDAQWLDTASARVLAFAARRTGESSIGILATLRGSSEEHEPLGLADAFDPGRFVELALGPLSPEALQHIMRQRFEVRIPNATLADIHAASAGNPMFALEFARVTEREDAHLRVR